MWNRTPPIPAQLLVFLGLAAFTAESAEPVRPLLTRPPNVSLRNEIQHAIDKSIRWLQTQQSTNGSWSTDDQPAITALVLSACMNEPSAALRSQPPPFIQRGYDYLLGCVQPDGGIYRTNLLNYNTSLSLMALLAAQKPQYDPVIRRARNFIAGQQNDLGEKGKIDSPWDGGIGYGEKRDHADMSNTMMALEALYYSEYLMKNRGEPARQSEMKDLNWAAVIDFIQRSQNLPSHNKEPWASDDPENKGGFVYYPGYSMAGETNLTAGRTALRSYGSITYAGLLSYIYAHVKRDDPRVLAAYDWLRKNYTLDENPALGPQGLFYYYHTMAKTLSVFGVDTLELTNGQKILWREDLAKRLLNLQDAKGFWVNSNARWWEKDPVLSTSYTVIALDYIARGL